MSGSSVARNREAFAVRSNGGDWLMAWHAPSAAPEGTAHGANAFCVTADERVVLISDDGRRWGWPGGRPEGDETWEQTLRREVLEEACAAVVDARLLGFCRAVCLSGPEQVSCWYARYGQHGSSCCRGSRASKSRIVVWSQPPSFWRIYGWNRASSRSIIGRYWKQGWCRDDP